VLFKHQTKIFTVFILTVAVVAAITFLITPVYEATASLLVKVGREYRTNPELGNGQGEMVVDRQQIINSELQILNNRELIEAVIAKIGVSTLYPKPDVDPVASAIMLERAVIKFTKAFTAKAVPNSNVISLAFRHQDPAIATRTLAVLIEVFKEKHLEAYSDPESSSLAKQLKTYAERLKHSEMALQAFKQKHQLYSADDQRNLLLSQQVALDTSLKTTFARVDELQQQVIVYHGQLQTLSQSTASYTQTERDNIVVDAQTRLLGLQLEQQDLLSKDYRSDSSALKQTREKIELVQHFLDAQEQVIAQKVRTSSPAYQALQTALLKAEAELAAKRSGAETVAQQLDELTDSIKSLAQKQNELHGLERQRTIEEKNFLTYLSKQEEARIAADLDEQKIANISVIQAPITPLKPVKPRKLINLILGVLLGTFSGLGLALLAEIASQSFSTPEQLVRRLQLPVLASIAHQKR
tara:strand:+ start:4326 stop:5732 length:1407 start_codon:yes stop_codon:yes gene_type:complete